MGSRLFCVAALLTTALCVSCASAAPRPGLQLDADSNIRLVAEGQLGTAEQWITGTLREYLCRTLGKDQLAGEGEPITFVIESDALDWDGIPRDALDDITDIDGYRITVSPEQREVRLNGRTALGTGYAVMDFLQQDMGVRFLFPGELGTHIPDKRTYELPAGERYERPSMVSRLYTGLVYRDKSIQGAKFNYDGIAHEKRIYFWSYPYFKSLRPHPIASPSHNMINIFPHEVWKKHRNVLPMQNGDRWEPPILEGGRGKDDGYSQSWHPCYSDPKTFELAVDAAEKAFENGAFCFSLGINDGRRTRCDGPACSDLGWPDAYFDFVARVANAVKDHYPPQVIGVIAYGDVWQPPKHVTLPDNVLVLAVSGGPNRLDRWGSRARHVGVYEWAHGRGYIFPNLSLDAMARNAREYARHNVKFFRSELHPMWVFDAPKVYIYTRQLWDTGLDVDAALREFCEAAYGNGASAMEALHHYWADKQHDDVSDVGLARLNPDAWPFGLRGDPAAQLEYITNADIDYTNARLREAKAAATREKPRKRIEMFEAFWHHTTTLAEMRHHGLTSLDPQASASWPIAITRALQLKQQRDRVLQRMRDHEQWFLGIDTGVNEQLEPEWLGKRRNLYRNQMDNILRTAAVLGTEAGGAAPIGLPPQYQRYAGKPYTVHAIRHHARSSFPWYRPHKSHPIEVENRRGPALRFHSGGEANTQRIDIKNLRLKGKCKQHWLQAITDKVPMTADDLYRFTIEATGRDGTLSMRVWTNGTNRIGPASAFVRAFGPDGRVVRRDVVLSGEVLDRETRQPMQPEPTDREARYMIELLWHPHSDSAKLAGELSLRRLDFASDSTTADAPDDDHHQ